MRGGTIVLTAMGLVLAAATGSAQAAGAGYVAMGSSFAAGPGVTISADNPATPCARSVDNYAHQLARKRGLVLRDVSCSGATTADILDGSPERPAQLAAVDGDVRLVTVTIGGNDLGYMAGLLSSSCRVVGAAATCPASPAPPTAADEARLEDRLVRIAQEVRRRAPAARLVFVQYFTVLPVHGVCGATPLDAEEADRLRGVAHHLAETTSRAAAHAGAEVLELDRLSASHDACSAKPWINGYPARRTPPDGVAYHPTLAGMTAAAEGLDQFLERAPTARR